MLEVFITLNSTFIHSGMTNMFSVKQLMTHFADLPLRVKSVLFVAYQLLLTCPVIIYLVTGLNTYNAYGSIMSFVFRLVEILFSGVLIPTLTIIVSLLQIFAILMLGVCALLIAALHNCPSEDSFYAWTKEVMNLMVSIETANQIESGSSQQNKSENNWDWAGNLAHKYVLYPVLSRYMISCNFKNTVFMYCGFCRLVTCDMNSNNKMMLLGIFNTWIPIKQLK